MGGYAAWQHYPKGIDPQLVKNLRKIGIEPILPRETLEARPNNVLWTVGFYLIVAAIVTITLWIGLGWFFLSIGEALAPLFADLRDTLVARPFL